MQIKFKQSFFLNNTMYLPEDRLIVKDDFGNRLLKQGIACAITNVKATPKQEVSISSVPPASNQNTTGN